MNSFMWNPQIRTKSTFLTFFAFSSKFARAHLHLFSRFLQYMSVVLEDDHELLNSHRPHGCEDDGAQEAAVKLSGNTQTRPLYRQRRNETQDDSQTAQTAENLQVRRVTELTVLRKKHKTTTLSSTQTNDKYAVLFKSLGAVRFF